MKHRQRSGYSLAEIVVTVLIIGIMAGIAVPRLADTLAEYRADSASDRVASDLAFAQKRARTTGASETVTFDLTGSRYTFSTVISPDSPSQIYEVNLTNYPYAAQITLAAFGSGQAVTFDGYGFPGVGGKLVVTSGGVSRTLKVDPATGIVIRGDR